MKIKETISQGAGHTGAGVPQGDMGTTGIRGTRAQGRGAGGIVAEEGNINYNKKSS